MKYPLFRMLAWVSVAPLGNPVVPDVYWMLIGSPGCSPDIRSASAAAPAVPAARPASARAANPSSPSPARKTSPVRSAPVSSAVRAMPS